MKSLTALLSAAVCFTLVACGAPPKAKVKAEDDRPLDTGASAAELPDGECTGAACATACDKAGRPKDCLAAAHVLQEGEGGVPKSAVKAIAAFEKSCHGGEGDACYELGKFQLEGHDGAPGSAKAALAALEEGCAKKHQDACYELGEVYAGGGDVPADEPKAIAAHEKGCELGRGQSCDLLAKRAEAGTGMKKDHAAAIAYLVKGCSAADYQVWTCASLQDAVAKKDKAATKAVDGWKKACEAKDEKACGWMDRLKKK